MDDLELIIYILAAIIWIITSNYKKVQQNRPGQKKSAPKKPKAHTQPVPEPAATTVPAEMVPWKAKKRKNIAADYKPVSKPPASDFLKTETESTAQYFKDILKAEAEKKENREETKTEEEFTPYLTTEDLKKAVIYSEILRRPVY